HRPLGADAIPRPRPRQQVQRLLRRGVPQRGDPCHPHTNPGSTGERLRGTLRPKRARGVPRLAVDRRPTPSRACSPPLRRVLQPPAPAPRPRPLAATAQRLRTSITHRRSRTPRPTRRTPARVPPRLSVKPNPVLTPFTAIRPSEATRSPRRPTA